MQGVKEGKERERRMISEGRDWMRVCAGNMITEGDRKKIDKVVRNW